MPKLLSALTEEFARTLRRCKKQVLGQPLTLDDISCVESQSFAHTSSVAEVESQSYEARRVIGTNRWDVSHVSSRAISGGHGITTFNTVRPVEGGQNLSIEDALALVTRLSPPEIRDATDACNRPAAVARLLAPATPAPKAPRPLK